MEAVWEEMQAEENGLGIIPYVMTTAGLIGEMEWEAAEVKRAVREFLADPRDSNSVTLVHFTSEGTRPARQVHAGNFGAAKEPDTKVCIKVTCTGLPTVEAPKSMRGTAGRDSTDGIVLAGLLTCRENPGSSLSRPVITAWPGRPGPRIPIGINT